MISCEAKICLRGVILEIMKEILSQKFATYHLPSSALDLIHNNRMNLLSTGSKTNNLLVGLSIIVTGATSGIGLHTARELVIAGAHVIMACRNTKFANEIAAKWREDQAHDGDVIPNVEVMELDLLSLSSVRRFATEWLQQEKPLHVLINNAGVLMMGEPQKFSDDGIEQHMQVNHFAPALLTLLLLPSLRKAPFSRIINVNSVGHHSVIVDTKNWNNKIEERNFGATKAYSASKLLHLMFLKGLANKMFFDKNKAFVQCIAVHPGIVNSNLVFVMRRKSFWLLDTAEGARTVIFCATNPDIADNLVKGFVYYSCNCKPGKASPQADNMEACLEVLEKTLEVLQLDAADYI